MSILKFLIILFVLINTALFAQIITTQDTVVIPNNHIYFKFEKLNNTRTKNIRSGRYVSIDLLAGDSTHIIAGSLFEADSSFIKVIPSWEFTELIKTNFQTSTTIDHENSLTTIPIKNIKSLEYTKEFEVAPFALSGLGALTAFIVAPLVSINKNSPNNFNSKRYTSIVIPSLIFSGVSLTLGYIIQGGSEKYKFKPTLINSFAKYSRRSKRFMARQGMTW